MKLTDLILKITALVLAVAAIACLIMANMERISDWMMLESSSGKCRYRR